jgi:hypothetical protein
MLLVSAAALLMGISARAQPPGEAAVQKAPGTNASATAPQFKCSGTVTDGEGHLLAGVTVEYWSYGAIRLDENPPQSIRQITTATNGAFDFQVSGTMGYLVARKPGLAPAWESFRATRDMEVHLTLTPPAVLAGMVVDETDKPVANAVVSVVMARREVLSEDGTRPFNPCPSKLARDYFTAHTDASGHFRIENFPANATAALAVQAPGNALRRSSESLTPGLNALPWRGGQEDIKLTVEPAGSVEGEVVVEGSNQPPPIARLTLQHDEAGFFPEGPGKPVESSADGTFHISDVAAGAYRMQAVFGTNAVPDWVAASVPITVESGQTARGVSITAMHGGLLEVAVLGETDRKPLAQFRVTAYKPNSQSTSDSDSNGIALLRLLPGDYQLMAYRESIQASQIPASVEDGKTNRVEIEIAGPKKITGIVRQPDGQPAAGVTVRMVGGFGAQAADVNTDAGGKFEMEWNQPRQSGTSGMMVGNTVCILVRDVEHNLAVAQDLEEETGPMELKLAPALTLAGRVESDGKPVTNATALLMFWTANRGMSLPGLNRNTNTPGRFEIPALPPGRKYGITVSAPGYGQRTVSDVAASADAGRLELDPFDLKPANLKLAGQVLDNDDKPVAGANVNMSGDGQPNGNARTDREGKFHFEHVCEGPVRIQANNQGSFGNVSAEGGDTNVIVRLGQNYGTAQSGTVTHKLKGMVTDADGKPAAGAQLAVFPSNGDPHWIRSDSNGAFNLTWSLQPWQMQNGGGMLVARDTARNLAASDVLEEDTTNLDVKLKPALTLTGLVEKTNDAPLAGAEVGLWIKSGNTYESLNPQSLAADAQGRYEIKCLPPEAQYMVFATAKGYGRKQQQVQADPDTNRVELAPLVLKLADHVLAGQVVNENDKPVAGAYVNLNGEDQPQGNVTTDSKGRFHFQVCEGRIQLFANSPNGSGYGQAQAEADDTNVVVTISAQPGVRQTPPRAPLKGRPLPDLAGVNLAGDAAPARQALLLCLFDAGQRSSRHTLQQLNEQAAALRQKGVTVLGVQAAITSDETLNDWKTASPVSISLGRVTEKTDKTKWALDVPALPWLILTDADHRVISEGFALDELDAEMKKSAN